MRFARILLSSVLVCSLLVSPLPVRAGGNELSENSATVKHVLLISVDGLHALDLSNYVNTHHDSTLALLSSSGVTYTNASTSTPSDSFPGLAALVTGGSPVTTGLWYDVTYDHALSPPGMTTSLPITGGPSLCPGVVGTPVAYDESIDIDLTKLNAGGGINPNFLPRNPDNGCKPIYPH